MQQLWFDDGLGLFMMFVMIFPIDLRFSLIFMNMQVASPAMGLRHISNV